MIDIVLEGFLRRENGILLEAHSTVTALRGKEYTAVIDTSSRACRSRLDANLRNLKICAEDVDAVILTHLHEDHTGSLDLFPNARIFAHDLENPPFEYVSVHEGDEIFPGIIVMHTPGHTSGSISILVKEEKCIIAGDAVPTEANLLKNMPPGICTDREKAADSMQRIISSADSIIPGHGGRVILQKRTI